MTPSSPIPHDPATAPVTDHSADKPVDEWVTGDEPMTGAQRSYLKTLSDEAGETLLYTRLNVSQRTREHEHSDVVAAYLPAANDPPPAA